MLVVIIIVNDIIYDIIWGPILKNTIHDMIVDIYILQAIDLFWSSHATEWHKTKPALAQVMACCLWPLLLTWFNFNPSIDK